MKWIEVFGTHINTNQIQTFFWTDGNLYINFTGCDKAIIWKDPDRSYYNKLCQQLGVRPYVEGAEDG